MEITSPRPFVFVLMPFSEEFDDVYKLGIKPACEEAGAYAERVDEQIFHDSILQRIYNQIAKADVIIADMTDRNPNVFYETGYAHALGKPVILLTRTEDDIPFDLKHYSHIIYKGSISNLIPELTRRVSFALAKPKAATHKEGIELYWNGHSLRDFHNIKLEFDYNSSSFCGQFDFHNAMNGRIGGTSFQIGLITSEKIQYIYRSFDKPNLSQFRQPDQTSILHLVKDKMELLPGAWGQVDLKFIVDSKYVKEKFEIVCRIYTEEHPCDIPFTVEIVPIEF